MSLELKFLYNKKNIFLYFIFFFWLTYKSKYLIPFIVIGARFSTLKFSRDIRYESGCYQSKQMEPHMLYNTSRHVSSPVESLTPWATDGYSSS